MLNIKYKNKYRIPSNRLQGYNYGSNGYYYVTICTKNRIHYFGEIVNGKMQLSEIGKIAQAEWLKTTKLRPDMNLLLDVFIVMPNHFHCVICIGNNQYNTLIMPYKNKFGTQSKNLASIIRGFKTAVTTYAKKHNIDFAWQERFYDEIINTNNRLDEVRKYIFNNPQNWHINKLNNKNANNEFKKSL